ncbi:MAG: hypothetical protein PHS93_08745 [Candidatus Omnitrophica bacterium]|nr:hypothetical protein [Candidatus Omnitrophota bacterium]
MNKELSLCLDSFHEAEEHAFKALHTDFRKANPIYEKIRALRKDIEDELFPSENMVDVETLTLRNEGSDKQEVRL